jgi:putative addiction module component (TIGR02574 family)
MALPLPIPPPGFDELPVEEKLDYVQSLWDRIAAEPGAVPVPTWHREVIRERLAAHRADPEEGRPWEEVRDEILRDLGRRGPDQ